MQIKIFTAESGGELEDMMNEFMPTTHRVVAVRVFYSYVWYGYVTYKPDKNKV